MKTMNTVNLRWRAMPTLFSALLLFALTLSACIPQDEPMVLSSEGEAVQEGAVVETTPGEAPPVVVEDAEVSTLATDEPAEEGAEGTVTPEGIAPVPEEGTQTEEGLAAEIGFSDVLVSSNYFINRDVKNLSGDTIADVDDLIVDLNTGQILYVVINYGDFLDLTDEDRPLPLSAFGWNEELDLVLRLPEDVLESVPAVEDEWPGEAGEAWNTAALPYWQDAGFTLDVNAEAVPVRVTELTGLHAGQLGAQLGVVEDMLLDLNRGMVTYFGIFAVDDFYTPDMVLLVPLAAANLTVEAVGDETLYGVALLEVDPEVLRAAPALDRTIFATVDFIDQSFTQELNAYWGEQGIDVGVAE